MNKYLQRAWVILASFTFGSVVRLLMRTVIIWRGICCTRLANATEGSNDASVFLIKKKRKHGKYVQVFKKNNTLQKNTKVIAAKVLIRKDYYATPSCVDSNLQGMLNYRNERLRVNSNDHSYYRQNTKIYCYG